jgi:single-stranded-DNA-specific exonuclease
MDTPATNRASVQQRRYAAKSAMSLIREGLSPLLARVLAGRGICSKEDIAGGLKHLHHHSLLKGTAEAAVFLADALAADKRFLVVADYDCDGATACSVALRGLRALGAQVEYIVPDRMVHGYGLTPVLSSLRTRDFPIRKCL